MSWRILDKVEIKEQGVRREEVIKILLKNRGLKTISQRKDFLNPKNPLNLTPKEVGISSVEIEKAIKRIKQSVKKKEKIIIYGDYDTDGVCATAIMWEALNRLGAQVMPFVPRREEGYGLKVDRIEEMAKDGVTLIITVDQGIVQLKQAAKAKKLGVDLIITDHHIPEKKKPQGVAIIHTIKLAGAGVAWFFVLQLLGEEEAKKSLDLATIGTITDIAPLIGPNRSLVRLGINYVRKTDRAGLLALYQFARIEKEKIDTYEIGYIIGPRLNAAGRMEDPMESLRLVCTKDQSRAQKLAKEIDLKNRRRQELMGQTTIHARELWLKDSSGPLIFLHHESYQEGIIGLVASRLKEEFYRPVVVVAEGKEWSRASARSIEEFDIVEAVRSCSDLIAGHGGHKRAAGFDVATNNIELVKKRLVDFAKERLGETPLRPTLKIDAEVELKDLNFELFDLIRKLEPFGEGNPTPVFATRKVRVAEARLVGKGNQHLALTLTNENGQNPLRAIGFGMGNLYSQLSPEKLVDVAYNLIEDKWNGSHKLQLRLKDVKV